MSLATKYRPTELSQVVGQPKAVAVLERMVKQKKIPHALLFTGHSGAGKTTCARIVARHAGCNTGGDGFEEINCAVCQPMEKVQEIYERLPYKPMCGGNRVYVLDEVQSLSRATFAQQGLLKVLEEPKDHVYLILCTTDPQKILRPVRGRCQTVEFAPVKPAALEKLVRDVAKKEGIKVSDAAVTAVVEAAAGSAREALTLLEKVDGAADQAAIVNPEGERKVAFDLVKVLMPFKGKGTAPWADVSKVLKGLNGEDPEQVRQLVMACARKHLLDGDPYQRARAAMISDAFRERYWDRNTGETLLAANAYEVVTRAGGK